MEVKRELISFDRALNGFGNGTSKVLYNGIEVGTASFNKYNLREADMDASLMGVPSPVYQVVAAWAKAQDHEAFLASNPEYAFMLRWNIRRTNAGLVMSRIVSAREDELLGGLDAERIIEASLSETILSNMDSIASEDDVAKYIIK